MDHQFDQCLVKVNLKLHFWFVEMEQQLKRMLEENHRNGVLAESLNGNSFWNFWEIESELERASYTFYDGVLIFCDLIGLCFWIGRVSGLGDAMSDADFWNVNV